MPGKLEVGLVNTAFSPPALLFLLRIALSILDLLWFPINVRIIHCSSSVKNIMGNLIEITLNL